MIHLTQPLNLTAADIAALQALQAQVDATPGYAAQVVLAAERWATKNRALFQRVRDQLELLSPGARRCGYCEDSLADEIEHVRPKSWFPGQAFQPENYLFACGPCNGPKSNDYAVVLPTGKLEEAQRDQHTGIVPPPAGQEALLHPRHDNPFDFLELDLNNTFYFLPRLNLNKVDAARAEYTRHILRLNTKDPLPRARREAFRDFIGRMHTYCHADRDGATITELAQQRGELLKKQHISVWREMQRQAATPLLHKLFSLVPGANRW